MSPCRKASCPRNDYSPFPQPENVGPKCVCVCESGCVVYLCTYMYNIYLQYILYISISYFCGGCHGDQLQYICNSFHHSDLSFLCIHTRFSCKPSKVPRRIGERGEEGNMGKCLILMKSSVCIPGWPPLGYVLNCEKEKSDDPMKSYPRPVEKKKVFCASVLCLVQKMTIYQLSPSLELVPLWKVTVNALLVFWSPDFGITPSCSTEEGVNRFRTCCPWIWGVTVALFTFLIKNTHGNKTEMAFLIQIVYIEQCWFFIKSKQDVLYKI